MNHNYSDDFDLAYCTVCKLYEGGLTTDCSGEDSSRKSRSIYNGKLDYRENEGWVNKLNPTNRSWLKTQIINFLKGKSKFKGENEIMLSFGVTEEEYDEIKKEVIDYLYSIYK